MGPAPPDVALEDELASSDDSSWEVARILSCALLFCMRMLKRHSAPAPLQGWPLTWSHQPAELCHDLTMLRAHVADCIVCQQCVQ